MSCYFLSFFFSVFIDLSGHTGNPLISHQISRAEWDFSNPACCQKEVYGSESGSDSEDERRLPDIVLDDLANRRFRVKKRPECFISKTTSPSSCSQRFPPADPLATGLYKLTRSEKFSKIRMSVMLILIHNTPDCLQFVFFF